MTIASPCGADELDALISRRLTGSAQPLLQAMAPLVAGFEVASAGS